jgi:putative transposase
MKTSARLRYAGYRFPCEIISHAVWLCFRFPLRLRAVEELLAARGTMVSHETVHEWARKFGLCLPIIPSERSTDGDRRAK